MVSANSCVGRRPRPSPGLSPQTAIVQYHEIDFEEESQERSLDQTHDINREEHPVAKIDVVGLGCNHHTILD